MTLANAELETEYYVREISADDEITRFLFSLGCYSGEPVTVVARKKNNMVISVKDARYNIDMDLANTIMI